MEWNNEFEKVSEFFNFNIKKLSFCFYAAGSSKFFTKIKTKEFNRYLLGIMLLVIIMK